MFTQTLLWLTLLVSTVVVASPKEQVIMLKTDKATLETTIYKPEGNGPFPLFVMNHGKASGPARLQERNAFPALAEILVNRGWMVVIPMRRGFAGSSGSFYEPECNSFSLGEEGAEDIALAVNALVIRPEVDASRIVVGGHSTGGLAALAYARNPHPGVKKIINFSGGFKWNSFSCVWDHEMIRSMGKFGEGNKIPTLWLYSENDSLFGPADGIPKQAAEKFAENGGRVQFVNIGTVTQGNGHVLVRYPEYWDAPLSQLLKEVK